MTPITPNEAIGIAVSQIVCGILLVITFLIIRYKQQCGDWKGVQNTLGAVLFMLLFIGLMVMQFIMQFKWF